MGEVWIILNRWITMSKRGGASQAVHMFSRLLDIVEARRTDKKLAREAIVYLINEVRPSRERSLVFESVKRYAPDLNIEELKKEAKPPAQGRLF